MMVPYFSSEAMTKIIKEVLMAQHDFIGTYGIKPNAVFFGIKQKESVERDPSHTGPYPLVTCVGMNVYYLDKIDHISVGLMGVRNYEVN